MISESAMRVAARHAFMNRGRESKAPFDEGVKIGQQLIAEIRNLGDVEEMAELLPDNSADQYEKFIKGFLFAFSTENFI